MANRKEISRRRSARSTGKRGNDRNARGASLSEGGNNVRQQAGRSPSPSANSLLELVTAHPYATLAAAAGMWMVYEASKRGTPRVVAEASKHAVQVVGKTMARGVNGAKYEALHVADVSKRSLATAIDSAGETASAVIEGARHGVARSAALTRDGASGLWDRHPLATGTALLAAAVAAGLLLPATSMERLLVGERSEKLFLSARARGGNVLQRGKQLANAAVREGVAVATDEMGRVGLTPQRIGRKVKRVASRVGKSLGHVGDFQ